MVSPRTKGKGPQAGDKKLVVSREARPLSVNNIGLKRVPKSDSISHIPVRLNGRWATALIDSGSDFTLISNRYVERNNIPYTVKKVPIEVDLADKRLTAFSEGKI